jgi:beta-glucosidase-like glycosyl hydrolase/O-glycosyl hydrolase
MLKKSMARFLSVTFTATMLLGNVLPSSMVKAEEPLYLNQNASVQDKVNDLLARMSLQQKIGQMVQSERATTKPEDVKTYYLGSVLSGGGSLPTPNTPESWANMVDAYQQAAMSTELGIPILYGADAVHGHNNVYGATIFPHNIGLGAAGNEELVTNVGKAVAEEVRATGVNWTFAPAVGIPHNERWGRTYETFGENVDLVSKIGTAYIKGLQGDDPSNTLKRADKVIATAKHYLGEGLTTDGKNQGNAVINDSFNTDGTVKFNADGTLPDGTLKDELLPPYKAAVDAGVRSVMVTYNSINGVKVHGNADLITKVLKGQLGFKGIVVTDYEGIKQIAGATQKEKIGKAINAGIDMAMEPNDWKGFITSLTALVNENVVSQSRIDDAVSRILTVKFEMGLFEDPYAQRNLLSSVGSQAHRDIARQAVRESLVLLKNDNDIVGKLKNMKNILVAGKSADDIGIQCGGWTITWQGAAGNITPGTTILQGIKNTVGSDVKVGFSKRGGGDLVTPNYDAAVVVIGETPYAETNGDRTADALTLGSDDITTINNIKNANPNLPIIAVLVSGRPITIADQIDKFNGLVEAWLPGTEGAGVADVLFGNYDFKGKLPITWPWYASDITNKLTDKTLQLFSYGYGLKKGETTPIPEKPVKPVPPEKTSYPVPGTVKAVDYDKETSAQPGSLENCSEGGQDIGGIWNGISMNYYLNVAQDGQYQVDFRFAGGRGDSFVADLLKLYSGSTLLTSADYHSTGGWQNWDTVTAKKFINLKAGKQLLTFKAGDWGFNFQWMKFTRVGDIPVEPPVDPITPTGQVLQSGAVSVTMSSAVQSGSLSWYDSPKSIPNALTSKDKLDIRAADNTNVTTINIDDSKTYQDILGMGTSIEGSSIANIKKLSPSARTEFLKKLVDPANGAGMNLLRVTIGTPDFTADKFHTYDDMPIGQKDDANLSHFSIQSDIDDGTISIIKEILALNPDVKLFASSWTPPGWMKEETASSRSYNENQLLLKGGKLSDAHIDDLAKYYVRYLEEYAKLGIPIYAITLQNEPMLEINYPSCSISPEKERLLSLSIKRQIAESKILKKKNINPLIWAFDHNFDGASSYVTPILSKENGVDGIAYHPYSGDPSAMTQMHELFPNVPAYLTERSVWGTKGADEIARYFRNYARSYDAWVVMLDSNIAPHQWLGTPDPSMFVKDANVADEYWATPEYYITGQFSKFVKPGAVRIGSDYGSTSTVTNVAFKNPDGSIVTIVINQTNSDQTFKLINNGTQVFATIPAQTVATYQWKPLVNDGASLTAETDKIAIGTQSIILDLKGAEFNADKVNDITLSGTIVDNGNIQKAGIEYVSPTQIKINLSWGAVYYEDSVLTVNVPAAAYGAIYGKTLKSEVTCERSATLPTPLVLTDSSKLSLAEAAAYIAKGSLASNVAAGNKLAYYLDVQNDGDYTIVYTVDKGSVTNAIKVSLGTGINVGGNIASVSLANKGSSTTPLKQTIHLTAGQQTLTFEAANTGFAIKSIEIAKKAPAQVVKSDNPSDETVIAADSLFNGNLYTVENRGSFNTLGYTVAGSYYDYFVNVGKTGKYMVTYSYAASVGGVPAAVLLDQAGKQIGSTPLSPTGGWDNWTNSAAIPVTLQAGEQNIRVLDTVDGFNLKSITFKYVVDTQAPEILGNDAVIQQRSTNIDFVQLLGITAKDDMDGDITSKVTVDSSELNTNKAGIYKVTAAVEDSSGNKAEKTFNVTVQKDATAPIITGTNAVIAVGSLFNPVRDLSLSVMDNKDGDITTKAVITHQVSTANPGIFRLKVEATDEAGNTSIKYFIVRVFNGGTIVADPLTLELRAVFDPLTGVKALDINGEDITSKVKVVSNNVDIKKAGTYKVVYSAVDSDGNTITAERTVVVNEKVVGPGKDSDTNMGKDPITVIIDENGNKVVVVPNW